MRERVTTSTAPAGISVLETWRAAGPGRIEPLHTPALALGLAHLAPRFEGGGRVLELGCGRGLLAHALAVHGARVIAIDMDTDMLDETRAHDASVRCLRADAATLPFASDSFDALVSVSVLQYVDWPRALTEAARVLKPGGRAMFVENLAGHPAARAYRAFRRAGRSYDPYLRPRAHIRWHDRAEFSRSFARVECHAMHLLAPLVLAAPALRPASARSTMPPALGRLFAGLASFDRLVLSRWPALAAGCWTLVVLAEKQGEAPVWP